MGRSKSHRKPDAKQRRHRPASNLALWTLSILSADPMLTKRKARSRRKRKRKLV